jgi:plastocyanin
MARKRLILVPLTAIAALCVASPSLAAESTIGVANYDFSPGNETIAVGDTVTWSFNEGQHSTTSLPGQPDSWDSDTKNTGATFQKTFTKPGRYQYLCTPHESFMRGVLVVGKDTVKKTAGKVSAKVSGTKATISFKLNEAASATLKLKGAANRTVKRKRLKTGEQSIVVKKLKAGGYTGTLTLTDDFDKKTNVKRSFKIR